MRCYYSAHLIPLFLQETLCLVAPYLFQLEPLEDFDPLVDFDRTGGDDVWFAHNKTGFFSKNAGFFSKLFSLF
jgi:hypothetical protein